MTNFLPEFNSLFAFLGTVYHVIARVGTLSNRKQHLVVYVLIVSFISFRGKLYSEFMHKVISYTSISQQLN